MALLKFALLCAAFLYIGAARAADTPVVSFEKDFDPAKLAASDVKASVTQDGGESVLKFECGHKSPWPGITFKPPGGAWDLTKYEFTGFDVKNTCSEEIQVNFRVDNPGADGQKNCVTDRIFLKPGDKKLLQVRLPHRLPGQLKIKLFGMNGYPPQLEAANGQAIDSAKINQMIVFLNNPHSDQSFEISAIRGIGTYLPPPEIKQVDEAHFFPLIDTFGQFIHADWPGKTHSLEELKARVESEARELKEKPSAPNVDQYGGWKDGPAQEATGFFRTQKIDGKWWFVDPDGKLFWSLGIDCVNGWQDTPIEERENWFENYPGKSSEFKEFEHKPWPVGHGHYQGKQPVSFHFSAANLKRKYGADWSKQFGEIAHLRLHSWGLNTIGAWSASEIYNLRKTPYTVILHFGGKMLEGSEGYWGKFRDVFDPSFATEIKKRAEQEKGKSAGDPWCLGYFVDNEIAWGDDVSLALGALKSPPDQPAKKVFLADLKAKYADIAKLNAAWGTNHASWDALLESKTPPDKEKAKEDLAAFYTKTAETYFKTIRDAVKEVAPKQLYLGCRFAWTNDRAAAAAGKYCDVVSYNLYYRSIADFKFPGKADVPLIVGEFHFGALDRGMFHTGLVPTQNQADRAALYKSYVQGALKNPQFVGVHWFQYVDEPTTGRALDGENYQIGFLDNCDTPYPETINAAREVGYSMYGYRSGKDK